jgi:Lar family restriction alleviation protein
MDSEALKPCPVPWCGRNAELKGDDDIYFTEPPSAIVVCTECGLETPIFETHAEAITAWNTRADASEAQAKTIEALQADKAKLREALGVYAGPMEWTQEGGWGMFPVWADGYPGGVYLDDNTLDFGEAARAALQETGQ